MRSIRAGLELKHLRILVVEDAADLLDVFVLLLRLEGADVMAAGSGHEALASFRGRDFDVVISEISACRTCRAMS